MTDYPLTVGDIEVIARKPVSIILSPNIKNMTLESMFVNSDYVVINYLSSENFGHWVCMYNDRKNNVINFFDSYGGYPDKQLKYIPKSFKAESMQNYPELLSKLYNYEGEVEYNYHKLQGKKSNTCGRWVGLYLSVCEKIYIDKFGDIIKNISKKNKMTNDEIILILTDEI